MPKDLAALLVDAGEVSSAGMDGARERQAEVGGTLDTALLELELLPEERLLPYLARAAEIPLAPDAAWEGSDVRARRVFPSRVAERHGLAPFALDGRELSIVAVHPLDVALLEEISFMLSLRLTAHVGPEWRVRTLIHRLYGTPLSPRLAAIGARHGQGQPAEAEPAAEPAPEAPQEPPPAPPALTGFASEDGEPLEPLAAALAQAVEDLEPSLFEEPAPTSAAAPPGGEEAPPAAPEEAPAEEEPPSGPPDRSAPPRWSLEEARAVLAAARTRDEVVLAALRYARDFFEFAAMFAVTRDALAGHDALGPEEGARDVCRGIAIYAIDPGVFRTVIETRSPHLGPAVRGLAGTDTILDGLARGNPRTILVHPVLLRDRPVCMLYADNGEAPVSARRLGDLALLLSGVGSAFERIIHAQKRRRRLGPAPAPGERWATQEPPPPEPARPAPRPEREAWSAVERGRAERGTVEAVPATLAPAPAPAPADADEVDIVFEEAPAPPIAPTLLVQRALDQDSATAAAACRALAEQRRHPAMPTAAERLRRALLSGIAARTTAAARALGAIRDVGSVPLLVQVLETSEPAVARAAAEALATITLQRLGVDARRWLAWWKANRGRGRAEWLFSGLTSPDRDTRVAAAEELSFAAAAPVAYSADLAPAEREAAARAWAVWWARSGLVL